MGGRRTGKKKKNKNKNKKRRQQQRDPNVNRLTPELEKAWIESFGLPIKDHNEAVMVRIEESFSHADFDANFNSKIPSKFPRGWREVLSERCQGLPFSTFVNAFRQRYGVNDLDEERGECKEDQGALMSVECIESPQTLEDNGGGEGEEGEGSNPRLDCNMVEEILARLPFPSLMRAKSVCKEWNTAVGALNVNVDTHHLVMHQISHGYHGIVFFNSSLNRWFRIPLQLRRWTWDYHDPSYSPLLTLCAAGGGLFLFVDWSSGSYYPVLCNPLTKQQRVLPEFPVEAGWRPGMAVELIAESDHFKVITIAIHDAYYSDVNPLVYNSSTDEWKAIPITGATPFTSTPDSHPWISTVHNGMVYCTSSFGLHLGCYDIACDEFKFLEMEGGLPPQVDCHDNEKNFDATLPSLVVCSGKLILVGRLQRRAREGSLLGRVPLIKHTLVGLWELDISSKDNRWSLIAFTPRDLLQDIVKSSDGTDFLVAASDDAGRIWFILRGSMKMLSFNLSSGEWSMLPGCPAEDMIDTTPKRAFSAPLRISPYF